MVLSNENIDHQTSYKPYFLPTVEIKDYSVTFDVRNFFDQSVKNNSGTFDNIRKIATGQGDDYTTGCLLGYSSFKKYNMIAIDLSKLQVLDVNLKAIQQINFTGNLTKDGNTTMVFITEEVKEAILDFSQENVRAL